MLAILLCQCGTLQMNHGASSGSETKVSKLRLTQHLLRSTLVAAVKTPLATAKVGAAMLHQRGYTLVHGNLPLPQFRMKDHETAAWPGSEAFEVLLDKEGLPKRTLGRLELYVDGAAYFPVFLQTVKAARRTVDIQSFIFDNDDFAIEVADVLKAKSAEVPVRIFMDGLGSGLAQSSSPKTPSQPGFQPPRSMSNYLREGSQIRLRRTANPFFVADHTKLHVIDNEVAFMGGMNIGREYRSEWHDVMVKLEGPVVQELQGVFERHWKEESSLRNWGVRNWLARPVQTAPAFGAERGQSADMHDIRILRTDTPNTERDIQRAIFLAIRNARRRVWIQTPYYSADDITDELKAAGRRGVDVRIIIPGENDSKIMEQNHRSTARDLMEAGVRVFRYPGMTHLKATIFDDWVILGSANYDTLSLRINRELKIAIADKKTVRKIASRVFERDFRISEEMSPVDAPKGVGFSETLADQL